MNGFENESELIAYVGTNIVALLMLWASWKKPLLGRLLFLLLFGWAGFFNWFTVVNDPLAYMSYADLTISDLYRNFIHGWFSRHIEWFIVSVAACQLAIAFSMLLKDRLLKTGAVGAMLFLLAIAPLGTGSAFPATLIMATAMFFIFRKGSERFLWEVKMHHH